MRMPSSTCTRWTPLDRRPSQAQEQHGLGYCNITKCCTEVCPEHIKITDNALIPMKERVADRKYDPVVWLGNKLFRRVTSRNRQTPQEALSATLLAGTLQTVANRPSKGSIMNMREPHKHQRHSHS